MIVKNLGGDGYSGDFPTRGVIFKSWALGLEADRHDDDCQPPVNTVHTSAGWRDQAHMTLSKRRIKGWEFNVTEWSKKKI